MESSSTRLLSLLRPPHFLLKTPIRGHYPPELQLNELILAEGTYRETAENIDFRPLEPTIENDSNQVLNRNGFLLPPCETDYASLKLRSLESKGNLFEKSVSYKTTKIPFSLKSQISISFGVPISPEAICGIMLGNSTGSKKEFHQDQPKIIINRIHIMLQSFIKLKTDLPRVEPYKKWVLRDEKRDYQLNLNDFTSVEWNCDIYKKVNREIKNLANLESFHILELPEQLFDCEFPNDTIPTLSSKEMNSKYQLSVVLKSQVYPGGYNDKLGFTSNIIVKNNDSKPHRPDCKP